MTSAPQNKELKLTKPCTIGASQLNSSVGRTKEVTTMCTLIVALLASATSSAVTQGRLAASIKSPTSRATTVSFRIANEAGAAFAEPLHAALRLSLIRKAGEPVPEDELWAPFDPQSGMPYGANHPPTVRLQAGEAIEKTVDLLELNWSPSIQSVWPDRPLETLATGGQYRLWLELEFLGDRRPRHVVTKKMTIELRGRPTKR